MIRRTRITKEGWFYLAIVAFVTTGAVLRELNLLMLLSGLLVGGFIWSLAPRRWFRKLGVRRILASHASVGDEVAVGIEIASSRRLACWAIRVEDSIERIGSSKNASQAVGRVL